MVSLLYSSVLKAFLTTSGYLVSVKGSSGVFVFLPSVQRETN